MKLCFFLYFIISEEKQNLSFLVLSYVCSIINGDQIHESRLVYVKCDKNLPKSIVKLSCSKTKLLAAI